MAAPPLLSPPCNRRAVPCNHASPSSLSLHLPLQTTPTRAPSPLICLSFNATSHHAGRTPCSTTSSLHSQRPPLQQPPFSFLLHLQPPAHESSPHHHPSQSSSSSHSHQTESSPPRSNLARISSLPSSSPSFWKHFPRDLGLIKERAPNSLASVRRNVSLRLVDPTRPDPT